jgi:lysyl-tRNA synthetase class 2
MRLAENEKNKKQGKPQEEENQMFEVRRAKMQAFRDMGIRPFGHRYDVTHHAAELHKAYADLEGEEEGREMVSVAGRLMAIRGHGKASFATLNDKTGNIQVYFKLDVLGEQKYKQEFKKLDIGDIVGIKGYVFKTRRGEITIRVEDFDLLSKSLRPLPEKFHGLKDVDIRYRQRYLDLIMNQDVRETFKKRTAIIKAIRNFLDKRGYLEVETPVLSTIAGGAAARPFVTHHNALDIDLYLRIATELNLKRLIIGGLERVYEMGRVFRNEGMDVRHNPEFTSIEYYQAYADYEVMMDVTEDLCAEVAKEVLGTTKVTYQGFTFDFSKVKRISMNDAVKEATGKDFLACKTVEEARKLADEIGVPYEPRHGIGGILNQAFEEKVEETLMAPTFVTGHPTEISPLAKRNEKDPRITDRFEFFIYGRELANGFTELNDPIDQKGRFEQQIEQREQGDDEAHMMDKDYIRAMEYGLPPTGGVGIGVDRFVMFLTDAPSIRDVLLFPTMKPLKEDLEAQPPKAGKKGPSAAPAGKEEAVKQTEAASSDSPAATPSIAEGEKLDAGISYEEALALLKKYNEDAFHITHGETVARLMRYYAKKFDPENEAFWAVVGLLHDLDWEKWQDAQQHTVKTAELLKAAGVNPQVAHAIETHNSDNNAMLPKPAHKMERVLWACDELSGLLGAVVLMYPSHSAKDLNLKSVKKKFKDKRFAAGCDRDNIRRGAELNGLELEDLLTSMIEAYQATND